MITRYHEAQLAVCREYGANFFPAFESQKAGVAENLRTTQLPVNGLRHAPKDTTCGWYLWRGADLSQKDDFFLPLHIEHLPEWCPLCLKFLGLPPGWRFLTDGLHEDVWFDAGLL